MQDDSRKPFTREARQDESPLALIAGAGSLPVEAAAILSVSPTTLAAASTQAPQARPPATGARSIVALGFLGITSPDLEAVVTSMHWLELGQLTALANTLRESKIESLLLLGKVPKSLLLAGDVRFSPDDEARALLNQHRDRSDDGLLSLIANWLEGQGFELLDQSVELGTMLAPKGALTRREPSEQARADVASGWPVARALGDSGVGQCVVMKEGAVLAVEAIEGTDETIRRAGLLGGGGATVIKALRTDQDRRFDLPAVGPDTIRAMTEAGAEALAIEAGATLVLERERFLTAADAAGIAVWGFDAGRGRR